MIRVPTPSSDEASGPAKDAARPDDLARLRFLLQASSAPKAGNPWRTTAFVMATVGLGMAQMAFGDSMAPLQVAPRADIDIRVGRNQSSGRIEIYGAIGSRASVRREHTPAGDEVIIRLPGQQKPDLGDIRSNPPLGIVSVDLKSDTRANELWLKVKPGYDSHFGRADGAVYVQIDPAGEDAENAGTDNGKANNGKANNGEDGNRLAVNLQDLLAPRTPVRAGAADEHVNRAAAVPVVALQVDDANGGRQISFPFEGPVAAAVFRRGDSVWVVFDQEVDLRLPPDLKDGMIVQDAQWTRNDGFTALKLLAPSAGSLSAVNDGLVWRVQLGGQPADNNAARIGLVRDDSSGVPALNINLAGATKVAWIRDPGVGDRMAVIPARGPVKLLATARSLLEATIGSTAQGAVVMHMTPDVKVSVDGDLVSVTRPNGLTMSNIDPNANGSDARLDYKNALYPSLVNPDWSATPNEGFLPRYNALQAAAADESQGGPTGPTKARLSLARFLVGQGLTFEAQGVLDLLARQSPHALDDPQVRGLRVAAKMLSGRYDDALGDLSAGSLASDPASRLWAGYAEAKAGHFADAAKDFKAGLKALDQFPVSWRMKMGAAYAYAAMQTRDMTTAQAMIGYAVSQDGAPLDKLGAYLVDAQIIEATGDKARALAVYTACGKASDDAIATPALMHAAMLRYQLGQSNVDQTLNVLDSLRYRWRGDDTELQLISYMGQAYLSAGRYREALQVLRSGGQSFLNDPREAQIQTSLDQAFRGLFLGGMADGLQPVEALGLFNDFRDLTPIGADGDEMVRRIVRRLVDVDLLDQAADLLQYQIDNRLQGPAKSSVAADLAAIYLMDHDPQKALQALWSTRTTLLPKAVMSERRVLEARALNELNEPDKALDVLGNDTSPDADDARADAYWRQQDWAKAATVLERRLGNRYASDKPLDRADEARVIRAGVAYSLLKDQKSLSRLSDRFGKFEATASSPDAMRVALAPLDGGDVSVRDFAAAAADSDSFAGWVTGMKKKFRESDDAASKPAPQTADAGGSSKA